MRITKFGHSCLFVEAGDARILIDPGVFCFDAGFTPADLPACNVLLITHAHGDHADPEAVKIVIGRDRPLVLTNVGVQAMLAEHGVDSTILARGEMRTEYGVSIRGVACNHAYIGDWAPQPENIGFFIAGRLFHPGDCVAPDERVDAEILAAPVVAPWMAVREAVDFIRVQKPKTVIPIHDGIVTHHDALWYRMIRAGIGDEITFVPLARGEAIEV